MGVRAPAARRPRPSRAWRGRAGAGGPDTVPHDGDRGLDTTAVFVGPRGKGAALGVVGLEDLQSAGAYASDLDVDVVDDRRPERLLERHCPRASPPRSGRPHRGPLPRSVTPRSTRPSSALARPARRPGGAGSSAIRSSRARCPRRPWRRWRVADRCVGPADRSGRRRSSVRTDVAGGPRSRPGVRPAVDAEGGDEILVEFEPHPVAGVDVGAVHPGRLT